MAAPLGIFDLFCGTGGFSQGFTLARNAEFRVVFGIDLLGPSVGTFKANHTDALGLDADITRVRWSDIANQLGLRKGELGIVVGGPPCQGFSSIRPYRSSDEEDPRNDLFRPFARCVDWFRPRAFVMENVVGLATHNDGRTLEVMQESFAKLGYATEWRILNAAHFGVPQRRERLIMVGVENGAEVPLPQPTHFCNGRTIGFRDRSRMLVPDPPNLFNGGRELPPSLTVEDAIGDLPPVKAGEAADSYGGAAQNAYQRERRGRCRKLTMHEATAHTPKMLEIIKHAGPNIHSIPKHLITSGFSSCYSRLGADEPSTTITVNFVHPPSNRCVHPHQDRGLTPREGARLQSFDDSFVFVGSRTQIVKQIGNAVPPLLGRAVAEALAPAIT